MRVEILDLSGSELSIRCGETHYVSIAECSCVEPEARNENLYGRYEFPDSYPTTYTVRDEEDFIEGFDGYVTCRRCGKEIPLTIPTPR